MVRRARKRTLDYTTFVDRITIAMTTRLGNAAMAELREAAGSRVDRRTGEVSSRVNFPRRPGHGFWFVAIYLPDDDLLRYVESRDWWNRTGSRIVRVEAALDVACPTYADAATLGDYLRPRLVQRYHRGAVRHFRRTSYSRARRSRRNLVVYDGRPSKVLPGATPCVHLELRVGSAAACRRIGVHRPTDLIDFDHDGLWDGNVLVRELPDRARLGRWLRRRGRAKRADVQTCGPLTIDVDRTIGDRFTRHAVYAHTRGDDDRFEPSAQAMWNGVRSAARATKRHVPAGLMPAAPLTTFLSACGNYLPPEPVPPYPDPGACSSRGKAKQATRKAKSVAAATTQRKSRPS